jgi:hypothetical protein
MAAATAVQDVTGNGTGQGARQQLLFLYLTHPNPSADTIAWSLFDGSGGASRTSGDADAPPYPSVVAAMQDGWRVMQVSQQIPPHPGMEHRTSYLPYEFILERMVETSHE